jgi:hypothetical protein
MKCPICGRPVKLSDAESPFCSERCREVDLGNWAMEKYVISTPAPVSFRSDGQLNPDDEE